MLKKRSFTLIELLIVIAVIVMLVAMLMPALSKTRYRAKLVVCLSNMRQAATTALMYAADNQKHYPYRKNVEDDGYSTPYYLQYGGALALTDVQTFRDLNMEDIQCPFTKANWDSTTTSVASGYSYYFGWKSYEPACAKLRMGKPMKFDGKTYDVIVSDVVHERPRSGRMWFGHPDYGYNVLQYKSGFWRSDDSALRGAVDMNFCREDGSAFTLNRVAYNDSRVDFIPYENSSDARNHLKTDHQLLPPAD